MTIVNRRPMSLTIRVVLFVAITISVCLILVRHLLISSIEHHFVQQDGEELAVIVHSIEEALVQHNGQVADEQQNLSLAVAGHHGVYYQVAIGDSRPFFSNSALDFVDVAKSAPVSTQFTQSDIQHWQLGDNMFRGVVTLIKTSNAEYRVISAIDMSFHSHFLTELRHSLWYILLGSCLLTLLAAWLAVYQGLSPLRGLSDKMRHIQTNKLDVRLDKHAVPSELEDMVYSFNHMLDRLEEGFLRLSYFSADIAHELRTPLTNIITQTQVSLSKARSNDEYRDLLFSNLEEQERLNKMISDMLLLAKSQNGLIKPQKQSLSLKEEINALFEFFEALAEESQIGLELTGNVTYVSADQTLLRHALTNLLSNAIRHTVAGQTVTVRLSEQNGDMISISVQNPGETIPQEHLTHLFDRFYRVDPSRQRHSDGAGLGLAIAKAIIEAQGGAINVESANGQTEFSILLHKAA